MREEIKIKKQLYLRNRKALLFDFHEIINNKNLSLSFKFYNLRNDFLPAWTGTDELGNDISRIDNPFWSQDAVDVMNCNIEKGAKSKKDILKGLQHDHVVPILFFEELIMKKISEGKTIPLKALEFLVYSFAIGAMVTAHQNQKSIDGLPIQTKEKIVWKKKKNRKYGMPLEFYDRTDKLYLHPWARYIEAGIEMKKDNKLLNFYKVKHDEELLNEKSFWNL